MSLASCLKKLGKTLKAEDVEAIQADVENGIDPAEAVQNQIDAVLREMQRVARIAESRGKKVARRSVNEVSDEASDFLNKLPDDELIQSLNRTTGFNLDEILNQVTDRPPTEAEMLNDAIAGNTGFSGPVTDEAISNALANIEDSRLAAALRGDDRELMAGIVSDIADMIEGKPVQQNARTTTIGDLEKKLEKLTGKKTEPATKAKEKPAPKPKPKDEELIEEVEAAAKKEPKSKAVKEIVEKKQAKKKDSGDIKVSRGTVGAKTEAPRKPVKVAEPEPDTGIDGDPTDYHIEEVIDGGNPTGLFVVKSPDGMTLESADSIEEARSKLKKYAKYSHAKKTQQEVKRVKSELKQAVKEAEKADDGADIEAVEEKLQKVGDELGRLQAALGANKEIQKLQKADKKKGKDKRTEVTQEQEQVIVIHKFESEEQAQKWQDGLSDSTSTAQEDVPTVDGPQVVDFDEANRLIGDSKAFKALHEPDADRADRLSKLPTNIAKAIYLSYSGEEKGLSAAQKKDILIGGRSRSELYDMLTEKMGLTTDQIADIYDAIFGYVVQGKKMPRSIDVLHSPAPGSTAKIVKKETKGRQKKPSAEPLGIDEAMKKNKKFGRNCK